MADMLKTLDDALLNVGSGASNQYGCTEKNAILYAEWSQRRNKTIGDFYSSFIKPRLPDTEVVLQWHKMLLEYTKKDGAVFPVRDGATSGRLRRGWLVSVDDHLDYSGKFLYMFTDNDLATYIYKMALDGFCPTVDEFFSFMTEFVEPSQIAWLQKKTVKVRNETYNGQVRHFLRMPVHFNHIGGKTYPDNVESEKNAYINFSPAPTCCLGRYGYKHAHVFGVKGDYRINGEIIKWPDIKLVELGEESAIRQDYQWDSKRHNFIWHRKMNSTEDRSALREVVVAHFMRFLNPMNHFLSPMHGRNKFTTDQGNYSFDIAEYDHLIAHLISVRENELGPIFKEFEEIVLAPEHKNLADYSSEPIDIVYHETGPKGKKQNGTTKQQGSKATATLKNGGFSRRISDKTYEIAAYYLRHAEGMATVGTKLLMTPDPSGSKTKSRLKNVGVLGKHKGMLIDTDIDDAILKTSDDLLKGTLEKIKEIGL